MMRTFLMAAAAALVILGNHTTAGSPLSAASMPLPDADAFARADIWCEGFFWPHDNHNVQYHCIGMHETIFSTWNHLAAPMLVTHRGDLGMYWFGFVWPEDFCFSGGIVAQGIFTCGTSTETSCPGATGGAMKAEWLGQTRTNAPWRTWHDVSGPFFLSCLEPLSAETPSPAVERISVDLHSGRVTQLAHLARPSLPALRPAAKPWPSSGGDAWRVLEAASRVPKQVLLIERTLHPLNRPAPLVKLESLVSGSSSVLHPLEEGRVVFRAEFSTRGELQGVEVISGDDRTAETLALDLWVEPEAGRPCPVPGHGEHRAAVYAVFDVEEGKPRLIAAVPVLLW